jgi:DME family drug/metabolite transporter/O-acetylserine/cysteine efflux transporter
MTLKDTLLAIIIILVWGVNFVVIAIGLETMPPILMGGLRFLFVFALGCWFVRWPKMPLKWVLAYALTLSFAQFALLFFAMAVGMPAGLASLVLQSQALFTLVFAFLILKEQIKISQVLAISVAGIGLGMIGSSADSEMTILGFVVTLLAAACWAIGNLVTRSISQKGYKADVNLVVWSALFACPPFFVLSFFVEGPELILSSINDVHLSAVLSLLYLALVATLVGYTLWSYLLSRYPAGQVAPLTLGVPMVGLASASVFLNEALGFWQLMGISTVMLGLMINMRIDKLLKRALFKK